MTKRNIILSPYFQYLLFRNWGQSFLCKFRFSYLPRIASRSRSSEMSRGWCKGKWAVMTGTTNGIGKEAALTLADVGVNLIMVVRNVEEAHNTTKEIKERLASKGLPGIEVHIIRCDLSSLQNVKACVQEIIALDLPISLAVLDAGLITPTFEATEDGHEMQFQVSYLSHFYIIYNLWSTLVRTAQDSDTTSHVVWINSDLHFSGQINLHALEQPSGPEYDSMAAYCDAKLACLMAVYELQRRDTSGRVVINAVDPGAVNSNILGNLPFGIRHIVALGKKLALKSVSKGAETVVHTAISPEVLRGGQYWVNCHPLQSSKASYNDDVARQLFEKTVQMLKLDYSLQGTAKK